MDMCLSALSGALASDQRDHRQGHLTPAAEQAFYAQCGDPLVDPWVSRLFALVVTGLAAAAHRLQAVPGRVPAARQA